MFNSGGEFKLCFCDSSLLEGTNEICDGPEDFTIEVHRWDLPAPETINGAFDVIAFVFLEWFAKARGEYLSWQICVR